MYRFSNQLNNTTLVLVKRHVAVDGSCAALIVMRAPQRCYSSLEKPKCATPPAPPKSRKLFWGTIGATLLTGAAIVYAKNSPDARNWLETNIPWANDVVALVYQENTTYWKAAGNQLGRATTYVRDFMFGREGITPPQVQPRSKQDIEKDAAIAFARKDYESTLVQTEKCEPESPPPVRITKDMVELEHEMHENTKLAIDKYKDAIRYSVDYTQALHRIIESPLAELDKNNFSKLNSAQTSRDKEFKLAREASAKARCAIETLDRLIKAGVQAPPESIAATNRYIKQFRADLEASELAYKKELDKSVLSDKYWNKVEQARGMFKEELEAMFPGIDLCARRLEIKGDTDLLLTYALKKVQYLQNELAELQTLRELKINRAIECHDEKAIIEAKVEDMVRREAFKKEEEFLKRNLRVQADANRAIKDQLKKQYEIQQEILNDRLAAKEKELMGNYNRAVSEKVEAERVLFKKELAAMAGKLKAIEQTLKERAAAETEARRSQSLWAAAEALLAATRRPGPETKLDNELKALEKAGKDDKLVQTVLKGIPAEVREKGIVTEKSLRDRFDTMEKSAAKVALIGREGATLPMYFLSWLQSKLLFQKFAEIPRDELENKPTDFSKLDTFDIIQRARYHMEHGDMPAALRYVNLLQGAARAAARPWADAARRHLEVRQAAEAVMAHASVSGLLYL